MILNNANIINKNRDKTYIDLRYFLFYAFEMHIIIISRNLIVKKIIILNAIKIINIKLLKTI